VLPGLTIGQAAAGRATLIATIVGVAVGAAVLVPSLALLYSLVLRGRLDTAVAGTAVAGTAVAGTGAAVDVVTEAGEPARARRPDGRGAPSRLSVAIAVASLVIGAGLLVFAGPAWAHGVGAVFLLACAVTVFGMAVAQDEES
jgi:cytochrome d ubiquinol oxidase subunit II